MKKTLSLVAIIGSVLLILAFAFSSPVFAWSQSTHAYVAKKCLGIEHKYLLNYNARLGCIVPDFFWYLRDRDLIHDKTIAEELHGDTSQPCVNGVDTTWFYDIASNQVMWWQFLLKSFTEGIGTHVYADIVAHNISDGYLEGEGMWVDTLLGEMGLEGEDRAAFREAAHLAIEFSVDALLVYEGGFQLADLLFSYRQASILEKALEDGFTELGLSLDFDVATEFRKYLGLMRALEKAAAVYAPYLISSAMDGNSTADFDIEPLMEAQRELSEESLDLYTQVFMILLGHPQKIYETITAEEMDWEEALNKAIDFCKSPEVCPTE